MKVAENMALKGVPAVSVDILFLRPCQQLPWRVLQFNGLSWQGKLVRAGGGISCRSIVPYAKFSAVALRCYRSVEEGNGSRQEQQLHKVKRERETRCCPLA